MDPIAQLSKSIPQEIRGVTSSEREDLILEVNGIPYRNFVSGTVFKTLDKISGVYSFNTVTDDFKNFSIRLGDRVRVLVKGRTNEFSVLNGFMEAMQSSYTNDSNNLELSGRDKTCDVVDSSLIKNQSFDKNATVSLKRLIEKPLEENGLLFSSSNKEGIKLIENATTSMFKFDKIDSNKGQNIEDYIQKYCNQKNAILTVSRDGDLVITDGDFMRNQLVNIRLVHKNTDINNPLATRQNNILEATATFNHRKRFNTYFVQAQMNPQQLNLARLGLTNKNIINQSGSFEDTEIRDTRFSYIDYESSQTSPQARELAEWHYSFAIAQGFTYQCIVHGFFIDDTQTEIWETGKCVEVEDDVMNINGKFIIKSVRFTFSIEGSLTELTLVSPDSYKVSQ